MFGHFLSPFVVTALVCEKFSCYDDAFAYLDHSDKIHYNDGGDYKATCRILGLTLRGRLLAGKNDHSSAEAAFEAAVEAAKEAELWFLCVLALQDLAARVHQTGHRHTTTLKRMGALLRKLEGPTEMLTKALGGKLDADELIMM